MAIEYAEPNTTLAKQRIKGKVIGFDSLRGS